MARTGISVLTLSIALLLTAAACSDGEPEPQQESQSDPAEVRTFVVRGIFTRAEKDGQAMHVRHEKIPDFMPAMAMSFRLESPAEIEGLEDGDKIVFTLVKDDAGMRAREIKKLPPETKLDVGK